jgi:hypothetical protein
MTSAIYNPCCSKHVAGLPVTGVELLGTLAEYGVVGAVPGAEDVNDDGQAGAVDGLEDPVV